MPQPAKVSDHCPPPQAFASWNDFTSTTKVAKGETALKTAQRLRLAELKKNAAGQRLWMGLKECRSQEIKPGPVASKPEPKSPIASLFE